MNKLVVARCISTIYKDVIIKIKDIVSFVVETVHDLIEPNTYLLSYEHLS